MQRMRDNDHLDPDLYRVVYLLRGVGVSTPQNIWIGCSLDVEDGSAFLLMGFSVGASLAAR